MTTNAGGAKVSELRFKPFGETRTELSAAFTDRKFTGQREESVLGGLYDYGARFYDPVIGRFLSPDTIYDGGLANPQGMNRYSYTRNSPLRFIDPTGHTAVCPSCTPSGQKINRPQGGTRPVENIFPTPKGGDVTKSPKLGPVIEGPGPILNPKPKGGDIKAPIPIGPIIEIPTPDTFNSGGTKIVESKGNPNPNVNPPGHKPGPRMPLPEGETPDDWPFRSDPSQEPPTINGNLRPPTKNDPDWYKAFWILIHVIQIAQGEGNPNIPGSYQPSGLEDPTSGGTPEGL